MFANLSLIPIPRHSWRPALALAALFVAAASSAHAGEGRRWRMKIHAVATRSHQAPLEGGGTLAEKASWSGEAAVEFEADPDQPKGLYNLANSGEGGFTGGGNGSVVLERTQVEEDVRWHHLWRGQLAFKETKAEFAYQPDAWSCKIALHFEGSGTLTITKAGASTTQPAGPYSTFFTGYSTMFGGGRSGLFANSPNARISKQGDRFILDYQRSTSTPKAGGSTTLEEQVHVEIAPLEEPKAKLELAASDPHAYEQWLPLPASDDPAVVALFGKGTPLSFTATLHPKAPGKPVPASTLDFYLQDVARHKGTATNYPQNAAEKDDLRFAARQPSGITVDPHDPRHAYTTAEVKSATVVVEATDTGAYGKIVVKSDELGLVGECKRTGAGFLSIPLDDNENHIADAWEKDQHLLGRNYPATWDEEDVPAGQMSKGDGLTLYEEYRGLVLGLEGDAGLVRRWTRLEPGIKKLFVYPEGPDRKLYMAGARKFGKATGIQIHFIADQGDLKSVSDQMLLVTGNFPRWLNFNSKTGDGVDFGPRQFAVHIRGTQKGIFTPPIAGLKEGASTTPGEVEGIFISRATVEDEINHYTGDFPPATPKEKIWSGWTKAHDQLRAQRNLEVDLDGLGGYMRLHHDDLVASYIMFTVLHELGHATGAVHHNLARCLAERGGANCEDLYGEGDPVCPMRYWDVNSHLDLRLLFFSGHWDPALVSPAGAPWNFGDHAECRPRMRLRQE